MLWIIEWKRCNFVRMREQEAITKHVHLLFIYTLHAVTVIYAGTEAQCRSR